MLASLILGASLWQAAAGAGIVADHITTERVMPLNGRYGWEVHEANPTPGMQTFKGRLLWSAVEFSALSLALNSKRPKIRKAGKVGVVVMVVGHTICSIVNERHRAEILRGRVGR